MVELLVVTHEKDFALPPIHVKPFAAQQDPHWMIRRPATWLMKEERQLRDNQLLTAISNLANSVKILNVENLEQKQKEIVDSVSEGRAEIAQMKQRREDLGKKHQEKYATTDLFLNGISAKMKENFVEKVNLRQDLKEVKQAERAKQAELEKQRLAEEEKERKLQAKQSRTKTPSKKR